MILTQSQTPQAISIPFNWCADYFNGESFTEYDLTSHRPNNFYSIKQQDTLRFGLFGHNMKFYFDNTDGHFSLNGKRFEVVYEEDNGNTYHLTNNQGKKDFIAYKKAFANLDKNKIKQKSHLESIEFGYKTNINKNDKNLFYQPIIVIPFSSPIYAQIKLTSDKSMNGQLVFYVRGKEIERFDAPLEANVSGQINWTIK